MKYQAGDVVHVIKNSVEITNGVVVAIPEGSSNLYQVSIVETLYVGERAMLPYTNSDGNKPEVQK